MTGERGHPRFNPAFPGLDFDRYHRGCVFIYVLVDPNDLTVRYVGQTANPRARRLTHREEPVQCEGNPLLAAWKAALRATGKNVLFRIVDSALTPQDADYRERKWIAYYRQLGRLHNVHRGGSRPKTAATIAREARLRRERADAIQLQRRLRRIREGVQ